MWGSLARLGVSKFHERSASVGQALREHRYSRRLTQAELAERAGLGERAVRDLERSLKHPQRATIHLLNDTLRLAHEEAEAFELTARSQSAAPEQKQATSPHDNLPQPLTSFHWRLAIEVARRMRLRAHPRRRCLSAHRSSGIEEPVEWKW